MTPTFASSAQRLRTKPAEEQSEYRPPTEDDGADSASDRRATTSEKNVAPDSIRSEGLNRPNESFLAKAGNEKGVPRVCWEGVAGTGGRRRRRRCEGGVQGDDMATKGPKPSERGRGRKEGRARRLYDTHGHAPPCVGPALVTITPSDSSKALSDAWRAGRLASVIGPAQEFWKERRGRRDGGG